MLEYPFISLYVTKTRLISLIKPFLKRTVWAILLFIIFSFSWVLFYRFKNPPLNYFIYHKKNKAVPARVWVDYNRIPISFKKAVIVAEDSSFMKHSGFDFRAIKLAYIYNLNHRVKIGASTISQQVARNVFLWQKKSWVRKGLEAYFTILIELLWGKKRILEIYLNCVQTGKTTFGIGSACLNEYRRMPSAVSCFEAARIVAVLPNPVKLTERRYIVLRILRATSICARMKRKAFYP